jgi:hypothetical protein
VAITKARRALLIEMERIVGSECWNPRAGWGEGQRFRYPIHFPEKNRWQQTREVTRKVSDARLLRGRYRFGANELRVFHALDRVLSHLEEKYGLRIEQPNLGASQAAPVTRVPGPGKPADARSQPSESENAPHGPLAEREARRLKETKKKTYARNLEAVRKV